jgi:hypothetical protein
MSSIVRNLGRTVLLMIIIMMVLAFYSDYIQGQQTMRIWHEGKLPQGWRNIPDGQSFSAILVSQEGLSGLSEEDRQVSEYVRFKFDGGARVEARPGSLQSFLVEYVNLIEYNDFLSSQKLHLEYVKEKYGDKLPSGIGQRKIGPHQTLVFSVTKTDADSPTGHLVQTHVAYYFVATQLVANDGMVIEASISYVDGKSPFTLDAYIVKVNEVIANLRFSGSTTDTSNSNIQQGEPRPCKAAIHLPSNLKPGEVLSPSYTITDLDGSAPKGEIYPVLYINGVQAHSVIWDGNEARIELQVSCQGQALSVTAIMPAYGSPPPPAGTIPSDGFDSVPPYDSSPAGFSKIPPPENAGQAMAGLIIPGIISVILGILGQSGAAVAPSGGSGSSKAKAGSAYDFGDGRDYYEGQSYTFDNGKKYKIDNGEFVPTAGLRDGEGYTDPDGNRKIWIGGQAWHEADWRRQAATNDAYAKAHKQDVDSYWAKRQQEIHEEQAAMHEKSEAEKAKDKEIEDQRKKVKELIRKTIEIQMDIDRTRRDIANRSAAYADRAYRGAQAIKYVCDKSIDIAAKIPGPKGEAFKAIRKAYRVTSAMAGGVGEGMASGNWSDSMVDATGAAVSNIIEDSIQTNRYKKGFEVFRGGTGEAWQQGRKAYRKGESIAGAAATGFVEGAAAEASKKAKEALEELAPGSKYSYTIGESSFKAGYKEYKKGGDIGDVMRASGSGYIDGGIDAAMDYGVGKIFENVLPEKVSEKTLADHIKYIEELEEQGIWMELYDTNRFPELKEMLQEDFTPEIIYDEIRKVADEVATKATQNVVKGKAFDDKLFA